MAGKHQKKKPQRTRVTKKALESQQFSSVRLPRGNEGPAQKVDLQAMYRDVDPTQEMPPATTASSSATADTATPIIMRGSSGASLNGMTSSTSNSTTCGFDPIQNDAMFIVVKHSKYWPPPSIEDLHKKTGNDHGDGFDAYDRRDDDSNARSERSKVVKGELNHPRGKPRKNTIVKLDNDSSDDGNA